MYKTSYPVKSEHTIVHFIKSFISKLRQNPDVYPIRYYKKSRRFRGNTSGRSAK